MTGAKIIVQRRFPDHDGDARDGGDHDGNNLEGNDHEGNGHEGSDPYDSEDQDEHGFLSAAKSGMFRYFLYYDKYVIQLYHFRRNS